MKILTASGYEAFKNQLLQKGYVIGIKDADAIVDASEECPYCNSSIALHEGIYHPDRNFSYSHFAICSVCGAAAELF